MGVEIKRRRDTDYYNWINQYKQRREILKQEIEEIVESRRERIKRMSYKIKLWNREVKRIQKREIQVRAIGNHLSIFMGVSVKGSHPAMRNSRLQTARGIFYKYCLEHKIPGNLLREYTGARSPNTPGRVRRDFTKSFTNTPENRELYSRFKLYLKDLEGGGN